MATDAIAGKAHAWATPTAVARARGERPAQGETPVQGEKEAPTRQALEEPKQFARPTRKARVERGRRPNGKRKDPRILARRAEGWALNADRERRASEAGNSETPSNDPGSGARQAKRP